MSYGGSAIARQLVTAIASLALLAPFAGCAKKSATEPEGRYTLSGRVRLVGFVVDDIGIVHGTRAVENADGVLVELVYGDRVLAQGFTVDGVYTFTGIRPGAYRVRASIVPAVSDETLDLTIRDRDIFSGDTLELRSHGDIHPSPNPFVSLIYFSFGITDTTFVDLRIRNLMGDTKSRLYYQNLEPGRYLSSWAAGAADTDSCYWVTFESGDDTRAHLIMR